MVLFRCLLLAAVSAAFVFTATPAPAAGPPAYLLVRRVESPGKHHQPGHKDAAMYDARTSGYAYGYFGAAPRSHSSRHFGYYRTYTQKSFW
jgi:hypothetical protein